MKPIQGDTAMPMPHNQVAKEQSTSKLNITPFDVSNNSTNPTHMYTKTIQIYTLSYRIVVRVVRIRPSHAIPTGKDEKIIQCSSWGRNT